MNVTNALKDYEVVFLAALVGMDKVKFVDRLAKYMAPGALLMLRSAHGTRAFLYPVLDPCDLCGFEVLSEFHPTDDLINSVAIARKYAMLANPLEEGLGPIMLPNKKSYWINVVAHRLLIHTALSEIMTSNHNFHFFSEACMQNCVD